MTTLITGFEPFADHPTNPSALVVESLTAAAPAGVVAAVLPTSYRRAGAGIRELIERHEPDLVLMLGLAAGTMSLRLETTARNRDDCGSPDNDDERRTGTPIVPGAPAECRSSLPTRRMAALARERGLEIETSDDAGGFVCNHVFYTAAHLLAARRPSSRCGFVHLPPIDGSGAELTAVVELIRTWIADTDST